MPTIVSVCHTPVSLFNGTMGRFDLVGRGAVGAETARFVSIVIPEVLREPEDIGNDRRITHERDGRTVAEAFAAPYKRRGVFVARGKEPEEDELGAAEDLYHGFLAQKFDEGLSQWEKYHKPELVDVHAKIAGHLFRKDAPWGAPVRSGVTVECEGCGEQISPKLAWHAVCGATFDEERAIALGYVPAMQAKKVRLEILASQAPPPANQKQASR